MDVERERPKAPDKDINTKQNGMDGEREDEGQEKLAATSNKINDRSGKKETLVGESKVRQSASHKYDRDERNAYSSRQDGGKGDRGKDTNRRSSSRGSYASGSNNNAAGQAARDRRNDDLDKRGYSEKLGRRDDSQYRSRHSGSSGYDRKGNIFSCIQLQLMQVTIRSKILSLELGSLDF